MQHVKQINEQINLGHLDEAELSIENLLFIGPNNTSALKLKAKLLESKGQFDLESQIWQKVYDIDPHDLDAQTYIQRRVIEDQEAKLFSFESKDGGQSFFVYPREMIKANIFAFIGCCFFLFFSLYVQSLSQEGEKLAINVSIYGAVFLLTVISPWIFVMKAFLYSLRKIEVNENEIKFVRLLKSVRVKFSEIQTINLYRKIENQDYSLSLVIADQSKEIEVDLTPDSSVLRARPHFLGILKERFSDLECQPENTRTPSAKKILF